MGKLAAGVAHEINNPAGVLLMKLKFLLSTAEEAGVPQRAVSILQVSVDQVERIQKSVEKPPQLWNNFHYFLPPRFSEELHIY